MARSKPTALDRLHQEALGLLQAMQSGGPEGCPLTPNQLEQLWEWQQREPANAFAWLFKQPWFTGRDFVQLVAGADLLHQLEARLVSVALDPAVEGEERLVAALGAGAAPEHWAEVSGGLPWCPEAVLDFLGLGGLRGDELMNAIMEKLEAMAVAAEARRAALEGGTVSPQLKTPQGLIPGELAELVAENRESEALDQGRDDRQGLEPDPEPPPSGPAAPQAAPTPRAVALPPPVSERRQGPAEPPRGHGERGWSRRVGRLGWVE